MNDLMQKAEVSIKQVFQLEDVIKSVPESHVELEVKHHFASHMLLRELHIPAGVVAVGKVHRTKHLTIIASGTVRITTDDGIVEITGPEVFVSKPYAKKAVFALTDAVIMNPHPVEKCDVGFVDMADLENELIVPCISALEAEQYIALQREKQQ